MNNIARLTPTIALAVALSAAPVVAQIKDAKPQAAPAVSSPAKEDPKPARKRASSLASVDARHCLQLATNMAIHQCAEKYRPR
jgi:hypothetical protein